MTFICSGFQLPQTITSLRMLTGLENYASDFPKWLKEQLEKYPSLTSFDVHRFMYSLEKQDFTPLVQAIPSTMKSLTLTDMHFFDVTVLKNFKQLHTLII